MSNGRPKDTISILVPGDLVATVGPDGLWGIYEYVGQDKCGFGDVVFPCDPYRSLALLRAARSPQVDAMVGRVREAEPTTLARLVASADPGIFARNDQAALSRGVVLAA